LRGEEPGSDPAVAVVVHRPKGWRRGGSRGECIRHSGLTLRSGQDKSSLGAVGEVGAGKKCLDVGSKKNTWPGIPIPTRQGNKLHAKSENTIRGGQLDNE